MTPTDEKTEWRIEPTPEEISVEMHEKCVSFATAQENLRRKLDADAEHLRSVAPATADEIASALAIAEAAQHRVEDLLVEKNAALDEVENLAVSLARMRWRISKIKELELSKNAEAALAEKVLSCFLNATERPSENTTSAFSVSLSDLARLVTLRPHIDGFVAGLQKKAEALEAEIISAVSKSEINFARLLDSIKKNPAGFDAKLLPFLPYDLSKK